VGCNTQLAHRDPSKHFQNYAAETDFAPSPRSIRQRFAREEVQVETTDDDYVHRLPYGEVSSYPDQGQSGNSDMLCG
jgi:hypothetical protein